MTVVGLVIALVAGGTRQTASRFHLNQALTLTVCNLVLAVAAKILSVIPVIGWLLLLVVGVLNIVVGVLALVGLINAIQDVEKPLPIVGGIQLLR